MTEVLIHLGMPKAGSTSLQRTLVANRDVLEQAGLRYGHFRRHGGQLEAHTAALLALLDRPERFVRDKRLLPDFDAQRRKFTAEFEENLAKGGTVIFSSEVLGMQQSADLRTIREFFRSFGVTPRFVMIIRPPLACYNSVVQEALRAGSSMLAMKQNLCTMISEPVGRLRRVLPETEFYPFADCVGHHAGPGGFVADLLRPDLSAKLREVRGNPGFSDNAAVLMAHMNTAVPFWIRAAQGDQLSPLRQLRDTVPLQRLSGEKFFVRRSWMGEAFAQIETENAWLAKNLGPEFCDPSLNIDDRPVVWTKGHADELRRIVRQYRPYLRAAIAGYFTLDDGYPAELKALAARSKLYHARAFDQPRMPVSRWLNRRIGRAIWRVKSALKKG